MASTERSLSPYEGEGKRKGLVVKTEGRVQVD